MKENSVINALGALAQEMRLHIVRYLISKGSEGASAGDIARAMDAISSKASFHLSTLEHAGLVSSERQSRNIIYRANLDTLGGVISFVLNDCCAAHPDIRACCELP
jgi:DNA-binding transcriptional ArsR family regulator